MTKLTDLESILLSTAAQRSTGSLLPAPGTVSGAGARLTKTIAGLLKRGLAEERETNDKLAIHRVDGDVAYWPSAQPRVFGIAEFVQAA